MRLVAPSIHVTKLTRPRALARRRSRGKIDDSYCATKFKFIRSVYNADAFSIPQSFSAVHEASGGAAGSLKCLGENGDRHSPSSQVLSDRLLDFPLDNPPGQLLNYCIAATADETPNKPKYLSAFTCVNVTVNFEARFKVIVSRMDGSGDADVAVTYSLYTPDSNATYSDVIFTATNMTGIDGSIQIKLNLSVADYPWVAGQQQLQMGFVFAKTSYFADLNSSVVHTFLCNGGRSQCNPDYPQPLVVSHLSFDTLTLSIVDNTYSLYSGTVGYDALDQDEHFPVAPGFWHCPLAGVKLTFKEYPGGATDVSYGSATTDATGYYQLELPIGARAVISSIVLYNTTSGAPMPRAHTFALDDIARTPWTSLVFAVGPKPVAGINFVDTTKEVLVVDIAGGACNLPLATQAQVVLTRNDEFCVPPALVLGLVQTYGWLFNLLPNTNPYSLGAPGVRFIAVVPAAQFEVVAYVSQTIDGNAGSAAGIDDYFFHTRYTQEAKPVIDLRAVPQLTNQTNSSFYASDSTSLVTPFPTPFPATVSARTNAPVLGVPAPSHSPTQSPFAYNGTFNTNVFNNRNTTELFESLRLVRFQYDGQTTLDVSFWQNGTRIDSNESVCDVTGAQLNTFTTRYLDTSQLGATQNVTAQITAYQTYLNNMTCSYLPNANISYLNQLSVDDAPCASARCSLPIVNVFHNDTDPVTGAAIANASDAFLNVSFVAIPTTVQPFANQFTVWYIGSEYPLPPYPDPGYELWLFVLGQAGPSGGSTRSFSATTRQPIAVVYDPPGDSSSAQYTMTQTKVAYKQKQIAFATSAFVDVTNLLTFTASVDIPDTIVGVGGIGIIAAEALKDGKQSNTAGYKTDIKTQGSIGYGHTDTQTNTRTLIWSVTTSALPSADVGANSDVFVILVDVFYFMEYDVIIFPPPLSNSACEAAIQRQLIVVPPGTNDNQLVFYTRAQLVRQVLPTLYQLQYSANFSRYPAVLQEVRASIVDFENILNRHPPPATNLNENIDSPLITDFFYTDSYLGGKYNPNKPTDNFTPLFAMDPSHYEEWDLAFNKDFPTDYAGFPSNTLRLSIAGGSSPVRYTLSNTQDFSKQDSINLGGEFDLSTTEIIQNYAVSPEEAFSANFESDVTGDFTLTFSSVNTFSAEQSFSASAGFTLMETNTGDFIDMAITLDQRYGTAFFQTSSGQTMCPHEPNTLYRELPKLSIVSAFADNISPGQVASYTLVVENLGNSDVNSTYPTLSTFVLFADFKQASDGVQIIVDGQALSPQGFAFSNIEQQTSFFVSVQVVPGSLYLAYELNLNLTTLCGYDFSTVTLESTFLASCPSIALVGDFYSVSTVYVLADSPSTVVFLVFKNLAPNYQTWSSIPQVVSVVVEWAFDGTGEWNTLLDPYGFPVDLRTVESPVTRFAVYQWDMAQLGLKFATINVRGVVNCQAVPGANPNDASLVKSISQVTGNIVIDLNPPYLVGFRPRNTIFPSDKLAVTFSEAVDCQGPEFVAYLLQPPGPSLPLFGGLSTVAETLVTECVGNTIAVAIVPQAVTLLSLSGLTFYLLLIGVHDVAGNAVKTNILASSPWYLYQQDGNVQMTFTYAPIDPVSTRFAITGLELAGISEPAHRGNFAVGDSNWNAVVDAIQQTISDNVGIDASRIDVQYFWFTPALTGASLCVVSALVLPGIPAIESEDVVAAFAAAYPALFHTNGAQTMDLAPMSDEDRIQAQLDTVEAQLALVNGKLDALMGFLAPNLVQSNNDASITKAPAPTLDPTPFPTYSPVRKPTAAPTLVRSFSGVRMRSLTTRLACAPTQHPSTRRPTPKPTHLPTTHPSNACVLYYKRSTCSRLSRGLCRPTLPTARPSHSPRSTAPSQSPRRHPTCARPLSLRASTYP